MNLKDRILNAIKGFSASPGRSFLNLGGFSSRLRQRSVENDPAGNFAGWVYAALSKRAKRIAAIEVQLFQMKNGGDVDEIMDHEMLALLYRANPVQSKYQFFYTLEMMLGIWGAAPIYKDRAGGRKIMYLWPLRPDALTPETDSSGKISRYKYNIGGSAQYIDAEEVIMINEPNPRDIRLGYSPLQAASLEIDADMAAALYNKYLMENFAEPGMVLSTENKLSDEEFERLNKQWAKRSAGPQNAGRTILLEKGLKPEIIGRSPQELDMVENRKFHRNAIVSILGVPMGLMTSEDVNLANAEVAERVFSKDTIEPQMELIIGTMNEFLVPEFGDNLYLDFESPVKADIQEKINVASAGEGRWMTPNEAREIFDLPALEGGDAIFKPLGVMPQVGEGAVSFSDPETPAGEDAPKGYPAGTMFEKMAVKERPADTRKMRRIRQALNARTNLKRRMIEGVAEKTIRKILEKTAAGKKEKIVFTLPGARLVESKKKESGEKAEHDPRLKAERKEFLKALPRYQKKFRTQLKGYFGQQQKQVLANLKEEGEYPKAAGGMRVKNIDKWINKILFDQKRQNEILVEVAGDMYRDNITNGAEAVARLMGVSVSEILASAPVVEFISKRSFVMLAVNETTTADLRKTLREGIESGEDLGQIRERITNVYDEAQDFRAETIARTEVGSAQNFGRNTEMENQKVKNKVWIAIFSNTREAHVEADGQIVRVDEAFVVDGERLEFPGDPAGSPGNVINCQCSVSPTLA